MLLSYFSSPTVLGQTAAVLASLVVAFAVVFSMLRFGLHGTLDQPNHRSLHTIPIPRSGGCAILFALAIGTYATPEVESIVVVACLLALVSWFDDQYGLPVGLRFAVHIVSAIAFAVVSGLLPVFGVVWAVLAVISVVWMTNLFNFMDGADGLAGGMSISGFGAYAIASATGGDTSFWVLPACIAAGAVGFLLFNFHPARIFLGDVGSIPLGFLAAALGLEGVLRGLWSVWFPILVFSPFIVDATITLIRRALRGQPVWRAHREHYYQRMVQSGFGHRKTALLWYAVMLAAAASACLLVQATFKVVVILFSCWTVAYTVLAWMVDDYSKRVKVRGEA